jgi:pseudomonalisin
MLILRSFDLRTRPAFHTFLLMLALLFAGLPSVAQTPASAAVAALHPAAQTNRIASNANLGPQTQLSGHVPGWATAANQVASHPLDLAATMHLTVVLRRDPAAEAALTQLLADQQNPSSPLYHQWLTPQQVGQLFGLTDSDIAAVSSWLTAQSLTVSVQPNRTMLRVSGSAASIANALRISFAYFNAGGQERLSTTVEPFIPTALTSVVSSIGGLSEIPFHPYSRAVPVAPSTSADPASAGAHPDLTVTENGAPAYFLTPKDFAVIYDINGVYTAGNTGATIGTTPQHVAIMGESRVASTDISEFAANVSLGSYNLNTIVPPAADGGVDPGVTNTSVQGEATLDVDRVIGTAPGAIADLIVSTAKSGGIAIDLDYNVNTLLDPIQTVSFGACEIDAGSAAVQQDDQFFQQAAAEGISTFISSGDSGANGCAASFTPVTAGQTYTASMNYLCSSSYVTCVGGTEFNDTANPTLYWAAKNSTGLESALSYIPEGAWNEPSGSCSKGTYCPAASAGGASLYIAKPSWQNVTGVPSDGARDTPDIAFASASHDGYYACLDYALVGVSGIPAGASCTAAGGGYFTDFSGTSAAAPSMAGIAALLNTKTGSAHGNVNPLLYSLFVKAPTAFHDVTVASSGVTGCTVSTPSMCNNSTPGASTLTGGLAGFLVTTGYDQVTGLGSLDVGSFLTAAASVATSVTTSLSVTANPSPTLVSQPTILTATLTPGTSSSLPSGTVQFYSNSVAIGSPVAITNDVATLSYTFTTAGTDSIYAIYSGDVNFTTSTAPTISLLVNAAGFTITPATTTYNLLSGATTGNTDAITIKSTTNFAGTLQLSCTVTTASGTAAGTCAMLPNAATLTAGSTATSTLTISTTTGTSGILNVKVSGVSGSTTVTSATITVNLTASAFTLTPSPAALPVSGTLISGNTVTSTVTVASTNGFVGNVTLTCSAANLSGSGTAAGTCSPSPASVTLTSGGTATTTVTIVTTAGTSGVLTATVTGTGTTANSSIATTASTMVTVTTVTPTFTLTPASGSLTFTSGATTGNTYAVTANSLNTFAGSVAIHCAITSGTAVDTADQPTCTATPASITLASGGTATSSISIGSLTAHAIPVTQRAQLERRFTLGTGGFFAMLLFIPALRRRSTLRFLATLALIACGLSAISGCSSSNVTAPPVLKSSAGSYTVTVTGTGTPSGSSTAVTATTTFTLTIN